MLAMLDNAPLTKRYWLTSTLLMLSLVCELFDFFIAGFIVSAVTPQWNLTFGQSASILVAVGLGAIVGSLVFGRLADQFGRKRALVSGSLLCSVAAASIAFIPDGDWVMFALLRFLVGVGYAGASVTQLALIVEFTPTRYRTLLSSLILAPVAAGMLLASGVFATLSPFLGWRGVALLGAAPAIISLLLWIYCPESVRWLVSKGRFDEARDEIARFLNLDKALIPIEESLPPVSRPTPISAVYQDRKRFWLVVLVFLGFNVTITGCYLTGPLIVAQLLEITPREAAVQFVYASLVGATGRVLFSVLPHYIGRVGAGQIAAYGAAAAMAGAGLFHGEFIGSVPAFLVFLIGGALFWDGAVSTISPYAVEVFPVHMAARGMGLAQAAAGVGKFLAPSALAMISGSGTFVTPQATADSVISCFLFLAAGSLLTGLAFTFLGVEPHGKTMTQ
jgi:putative MFS transporter